jgi:hypothetical protein
VNRDALLGGGASLVSPVAPVLTRVPSTAPSPPRLVCAVPSFDTWKADMAMAFTAMVGFLTYNRLAVVATANQKASMITMARNDLVQRAMEMNGDYILFIDSDLTFPVDAAARLMNHNKDIVGATYNKRVPPYETLGKLAGPPRDLSQGGLVPADYLPGGFLMVKMDVFRKLQWPWFFECYNREGEPIDAFISMLRDIYMLAPTTPLEESLRGNEELVRWLQDDWPLEPGNRCMSEDYSFNRKARRAGYEIWCDLDLTWQMRHIGEQAVSCTPPGKEGAVAPAPAVAAGGRPPAIITV